MKKKVIKPFSLKVYNNSAKARARTQTRDGHKVKIVYTDVKKPNFPIIGLIKLEDGSEAVQSYTTEGRIYYKGSISDNDLVIVEEVEVIEDFWSDKEKVDIEGYGISIDSITNYCFVKRTVGDYCLFKTEKQAKSARAMAKITQIMANDIKNFGGVVTDEEWTDDNWKYVIFRSCNHKNRIGVTAVYCDYHFLAFHTAAQRDLFLEKYRDLVSDYFMLD
jgi:hypothetical protein